MAKEQNLSLNPTKISGVCGRLMCCLKNEQETYEYLNSKLPNVGEKLKTKDGVVGEVQRVDVLRQKVKLIVEDENGDKEIQEYKIDDLLMRKKKPQGCQGCGKGCNNKNQGCNKGHGKRKN
jgi:cell fate regulator YaaT (PSP1 superfamily)